MALIALNNKNEEVNILHFQGGNIFPLDKIFNIVKNNAELKPISNLSIISCWTDDSKCHLLHQLTKNNINLINALPEDYDFSQKWDMRNKIRYYINCLENINTTYSLLLDGYDVLFVSTDNILNKFKNKGYKIIFNTTINNYPDEKIDIIYNNEKYEFKYFNAGCCIGYTSELLKFYKECLEYINIENKLNSEQKILRHAFSKYSNDPKQRFIYCDFRRNIFHSMGFTKCSYNINYNKLYINLNKKGIKNLKQINFI